MALRRLKPSLPGETPAPGRWEVTRRPVAGATRLATVERADDIPDLITSGVRGAEGALVRVRPALGEDGESLSRAILGAGAGGVRVEPGMVEGLPDLAEPDPEGSPRELALARARALKTEHAGELVAEVERALTAGGL